MLSFMDPPPEHTKLPVALSEPLARPDGVRLQFTLSRDPERNVFNVREQLAPPKPPPKPKHAPLLPQSNPEPSNVDSPAPEASEAPETPGLDGAAPSRDGHPNTDVEDGSRDSGDEDDGEGEAREEDKAEDGKEPDPDAAPGAPGVGAEAEAEAPPRRRRRRKLDEEDFYDFNDPFIDDSDLQEFGLGQIIKPKMNGYFMWRGPVETVVEELAVGPAPGESPPKRKYTKRKLGPNGAATGPAGKKAKTGEGGAEGVPSGAPGTEGAPKKRRKKGEAGPDAALSVKTEGNLANGTPDNPDSGVATPTALAKPGAEADAPEKVRVKITEETPLHDSLLPAMQHLRDLASLETWENKQKFPALLKPILLDAARIALDLSPDESLEINFLHQLTQILPYNKLTLRNLIQRQLLPERIEQKKAQLVAAYDAARPKIAKQTVPSGETKQEAGGVPASPGPSQGMKISWNKDLRTSLFLIFELELAIAKLEDEFRVLNKQDSTFDEVKTKALAYDHIFALFPEGLIKRDAISRNFSLHKQQIQKKETTGDD